MIDLGQWLLENAHRRREANEWDCCGAPAAWCMANGYPDPMAQWRGEYTTDDEGEEWIAKAGGLDELFSVGLGSIHLPTVTTPSPGVIGVLRVGEHEAGAIYTGKRWALIAERGITFASFNQESIVKMWAV